jgi:Protein of unknown function (DUF3592)
MKRGTPWGCLLVIGLIFVTVACGGLALMIGVPLIKTIQAQRWEERTALILKSELAISRDNDGSVYSPEVDFEYEYQGKKYRSSTWSTGFASSSFQGGAQSVVKRYSTGSEHPCFVNPDEPSQAVLDRSFQKSNLFALFMLIFLAIGGGLVWASVRVVTTQRRQKRDAANKLAEPTVFASSSTSASSNIGTTSRIGAEVDFDDEDQQNDSEDDDDLESEEDEDDVDAPWYGLDGPQKLEPISKRLTVFLGVLFVALFWNGISWTIFLNGLFNREWFTVAFLLIFVGIGAIMFYAAFYNFLRLFNPTVSVALSNGAVYPGETVDLAWELVGRVSRIRELRVSIIGEEVVTYVRGTNTSTDRKMFQRIPIASVTSDEEKRFGSASITIPPNTIHSFDAPNNKIEWSVEVHGTIAWWPDIRETMRFAVRPATISGDQP